MCAVYIFCRFCSRFTDRSVCWEIFEKQPYNNNIILQQETPCRLPIGPAAGEENNIHVLEQFFFSIQVPIFYFAHYIFIFTGINLRYLYYYLDPFLGKYRIIYYYVSCYTVSVLRLNTRAASDTTRSGILNFSAERLSKRLKKINNTKSASLRYYCILYVYGAIYCTVV